MHACYNPLPCDDCNGVDDIYEIIFVNETVYGFTCPNNTVVLASGPCFEAGCTPAIFYAPTPNDLSSLDQAKSFVPQARTVDPDDLYNGMTWLKHYRCNTPDLDSPPSMVPVCRPNINSWHNYCPYGETLVNGKHFKNRNN